MQRLEVSGAVRPMYGSLGVKRLMTILDNYMFRPLLAIFMLYLRELKVLLYNVRARDGEISTTRFCCVIVNYYVQCGGVICTTP